MSAGGIAVVALLLPIQTDAAAGKFPRWRQQAGSAQSITNATVRDSGLTRRHDELRLL